MSTGTLHARGLFDAEELTVMKAVGDSKLAAARRSIPFSESADFRLLKLSSRLSEDAEALSDLGDDILKQLVRVSEERWKGEPLCCPHMCAHIIGAHKCGTTLVCLLSLASRTGTVYR